MCSGVLGSRADEADLWRFAGCSAAQIVPEIVHEAASVTQIARSRQSIIRRIKTPDNAFIHFLMRWIPGVSWADLRHLSAAATLLTSSTWQFGFIMRSLIFLVMESFFKITDIRKGERERKKTVKEINE